jgi:hypothetical protein
MIMRVFCLLAAVAFIAAQEAIPGATAAEWLNDPEAAAKAAGAAAKALEDSTGFWAAVSGGTLAALAFLRLATPTIARIIPVWGPIVEGVANFAWNTMATKNQKQADQAAAVAHQAADKLVDLAEAVRLLPPGSLPPSIEHIAHSAVVTTAIDSLRPQAPAKG